MKYNCCLNIIRTFPPIFNYLVLLVLSGLDQDVPVQCSSGMISWGPPPRRASRSSTYCRSMDIVDIDRWYMVYDIICLRLKLGVKR